MSEYAFSKRVIAATLAIGVGTIGLAGCSSSIKKPEVATTTQATPDAGTSVAQGPIVHCQVNPNVDARTLAQAGYGDSEISEMATEFNIPVAEMTADGMAFETLCDQSLSGSFISQYGVVPYMEGNPKAANKFCFIWTALYASAEAAQADGAINHFEVVCNANSTVTSPTPTVSASALLK